MALPYALNILGTGCHGKPTEFFMHATKLDITYNYYYNIIHTMQFILENYDLVTYDVPKNPKPIDSPTYSEMIKSTSQPNLRKIKGS